MSQIDKNGNRVNATRGKKGFHAIEREEASMVSLEDSVVPSVSFEGPFVLRGFENDREPLTDWETEMLTIESLRWKYSGSKEARIRETFDLNPTKYYILLNQLIDSRAALEANPSLVNRLRGIRERRLASARRR